MVVTDSKREEISQKILEKYRNVNGQPPEKLVVYLCRWCHSQQVASVGEICHICADIVKKHGRDFRFAKEVPFQWNGYARAFAYVIVFAIIFAIILLLITFFRGQ